MRRIALVLLPVTLASAIACHDPDQYLPVSPENPDGFSSPILELKPSVDTIPASGVAHTSITAKVDARSSVRRMTFATTGGTLSGHGQTSTPTKMSIEVPIDDNGDVTVDLRSDTQPGGVTVTASMTLVEKETSRTFTRTTSVTFSPVLASEVLTLTVAPTAATADGASRVLLTATVSQGIANGTDVVFTATGGSFATNRDTASPTPQARVSLSGGVAAVELISPRQPVNVTVTAQVSTFRQTNQVTFGAALPDTIFVQPSKSTVSRTGETVTITAYLFRDVGQISSNTGVTYEARDSAGNPLGTFIGATLAVPDQEDESEFKRLKSTVTFDPDATAALGTATITARAAGRSASTTVVIAGP